MARVTEVKKVDCYECSDGNVFKDKESAFMHQSDIDKRKAVEDFVDSHCYNGMSKSDIADFIIDNIDEIKKILK